MNLQNRLASYRARWAQKWIYLCSHSGRWEARPFSKFPLDEFTCALTWMVKAPSHFDLISFSDFTVHENTSFPLTISASLSDQLVFNFVGNNGYFKENAIKQLSQSFIHVLSDGIRYPNKKVGSWTLHKSDLWIDLLSEECLRLVWVRAWKKVFTTIYKTMSSS